MTSVAVSEAKTSYAAALDQTVTIRRYTGLGAARTHTDYTARADIAGFSPTALVGNVMQGDRKVIVYSDDLATAGFSEPITVNDKAVVRGKELAIIAVDDSTRRIEDVLIAYELQARG